LGVAADGSQIVVRAGPHCLVAGTMVATPSGELLVEDIRPGEEVLTADGEAATVRWVGRQSLIIMFTG
jgi:hypothetical protein